MKESDQDNLHKETPENDVLLEDVFRAYYNARKHKRNTESQLKFEINLEENLIDIYHKLKDRTWRPSQSVCFIITKPVKREVFASPFKDRIIHHLLCGYIAPIFERYLIHDSYSCRNDKGNLFGSNRLVHYIKSCSDNYTKEAYVLKLDIQGYFMNINKVKLYAITINLLNKYWSRNRTTLNKEFIFYLLKEIIFNEPSKNCKIHSRASEWEGLPDSKSLLKSPDGVGLPIGDLTSQLFSNIYLGELDNFVKHKLKIKCYGRYVDDFYFVHNSKAYLKTVIKEVDVFLKENLDIEIHRKKIYLQNVKKGVSFLGIIVKPYRIYPSRRIIGSFYARMKEARETNLPPIQLQQIVNSYLGTLKYSMSFKIRKKMIERNVWIFKYGWVTTKYLKFNTLKRKT